MSWLMRSLLLKASSARRSFSAALARIASGVGIAGSSMEGRGRSRACATHGVLRKRTPASVAARKGRGAGKETVVVVAVVVVGVLRAAETTTGTDLRTENVIAIKKYV